MIAITHVPSPRMQACELTFVSRQAIDYAEALAQHAGYCRALADCGWAVRTLDVNLALPDCAFIEDTAVVLDEVALVASMSTDSRRGELGAIEAVLREYRPIVRVEKPATLEGGDVLRVGRTLIVGKSRRTNPAGIESLAETAGPFGYRVVPIEVGGCLHLKTGCTALPDGRLLVNRRWIELARLREFELVDVPDQEPWGANILLTGECVLLAGENAATAELLRSLGFGVRTTNLSQFARAEGGATCLSLLVG
jgi:dimethylargininase